MFKRKKLILSICFLFIMSISAVSADENLTLADDCVADVGKLTLGNDELTDEKVNNGESVSTFDDLAQEIGNAEEGGTVNLTKDYTYESGSNEGIVINKSITINGNNHKLDGKGQSRIFTNNAGTVTLNNLILVNGYHDKGGAIFVNDSVTCNDVVFENNHASNGGAIYVQGNITVNDCIFDGNHALKGAAIYITNAPFIPPDDGPYDYNDTEYSDEQDYYSDDAGEYNDTEYSDEPEDYGDDAEIYDDGEEILDDDNDSEWDELTFSYFVYNSLFKNSYDISEGLIYSDSIDLIKIDNSTFANSSSMYGAAVAIRSSKVFFNNTSFINLYSSLSGGAVATFSPTELYFRNCSFINTSSYSNGGAVCADVNGEEWDSGNKLTFKNCEFKNSGSNFGGAIVQIGGLLSIRNSVFEDNYARYNGGALYASFVRSKIKNSTFKNNKLSSTGNGGAIYVFDEILDVNGSKFINNSLNAIYSCQNQYNVTNSFFNNNTQAIYSIYYVNSILEGNNYTNDVLVENSTAEDYYVLIIGSDGIRLNPIKNDIDVEILPSRYDSRDWGWVTPVKDQKTSGACWVFGTCSVLEANILKSFGVEYNISINNIHKNLLKYSKYGHSLLTESGLDYVAGEYVISWYGAVPEKYAPFDLYGKIAMPIITSDAFHIQDMLWLSGRKNATDNDEIKNAIMKYGAVTAGVAMYDDAPYFNRNTSALYVNSGRGPSGHVVCIVGWDDNYPASNFYLTPPGNGAWIVKNSYGSSNYDGGYIYVSYFDDIIGYEPNNLAFIFENTENYNKNYQTDIGGVIVLLNGTDEYIYKNNYCAIEADFISAVGTYFIGEGEEYSLEIHVNGKLKHLQKGVAPFRGFHTVKLSKNIPIKKGDNFTVVMKKSSMPVLNQTQQHFKKGDSLAYEKGSWKDLSLDNLTASLKVYTMPLENLKTTIKSANVITTYNGGKYLVVTVKDVYGDVLKGVKVTVKLSNGVKKTFITNSKGQIKFLTNNLAPGTYVAKITTPAFGKYIESSSNAKIVVKRASTKIIAKSHSFKVKTKIKNVKVALKTGKNKAIRYAKITIKVGSKIYSTKTNKYGIATLKVTKLIKKGNYRAIINFAGNKYYNKVSKKIIVKIR